MKKRFTEEQIIRIVKEHESGKKAADIIREHGISEQHFAAGRVNSGEWMSTKPNDLSSWKKKTKGLRKW